MLDNNRFALSNEVDFNSLKDFEDLLKFSKSNNIRTFGILPPISPNFYDALTTLSDSSNYYEKYRKEVCELMQKYDYKCLDILNLKETELINKHEKSFLDRMHPDQELMQAIFKKYINPYIRDL